MGFGPETKGTSSKEPTSNDTTSAKSPSKNPHSVGQVLNRSELTVKEQSIIARQQCDPLSEEHQTWHEKIRKIIFEKLKTIDFRYNGFEKFDDARQVQYKDSKKIIFSLTLWDMARFRFPVVPKDYMSMNTMSSAVTDNYIRLNS
jgi:hypothetical protein